MRETQRNAAYPTWLSAVLTVGILVLAFGVLWWARDVLMPIALAILLSFILSPIVTLLRKTGVGQRISVTLTVVLAFVLIGSIGMLVVAEFRGLANQLPAYEQNIRAKVSDLHLVIKSGSLGKVRHTMQEVVKELKKDDPPENKSTAPIPVVIKDAGGTFDLAFVRSLFGPAVTAGLVVMLVIFMLLRREDLRDRLLQMAGHGRLVVTTKAIDEASKQVSRYLLRQFLVNTGFGIMAGIGFGLIGLPYALLWGFFAGVARFVPYLGSVLGVIGPVFMSLAVFDGWMSLLMVIGLFACLELLTGMLIEPLIYGQGIGVSEVALLIMIAFWTWLWGPVGLVLATPLTVCLMVISKSVPNLEFIALLLSREPALDVHRVFYHRLIAEEDEEAQNVVAKFLEKHSKADLFEQLLIPTLIACRHDYRRRKLTDEDREFIFQEIHQIIEDCRDLNPTMSAGDGAPAIRKIQSDIPGEEWQIIGCPAHDEADELALLMLAQLLDDEHLRMRVIPAEKAFTEALAEVEKNPRTIICIGCLPQGPTLPVRQLCKQLRSRFPDLSVMIGRWGAQDQENTRQRFAGLAIEFGWKLVETKNQLIQLSQTGNFPIPQGNNNESDKRRLAFSNAGGIVPGNIKIMHTQI